MYPLLVCTYISSCPPLVESVSPPPVHVIQVRKLEEALEASNQELEKSKEVLKTNENGGGL